MSRSKLDEVLERIQELERELSQELEELLQEKQQQFRYRLEKGKAKFEKGVASLQRRRRVGLFRYLFGAELKHLLTSPVIYSLIIPFTLLDLWVTIYQHVCFRAYGIPRVKRREYIVIDRHRLAYLNLLEKINCVYCGYVNGVIAYVREVAGRTEQYWCPIKHARVTASFHPHTHEFTDFGDAEAYRDKLVHLRSALSKLSSE